MRGQVKKNLSYCCTSGVQCATFCKFYKTCRNLKLWRVPICRFLQKRASEIYN